MLDIPGEMQVMLKVRVAELSRSALRNIGSQLNLNFGDFSLNSSFGLGGAFNAVLNSKNAQLTIDAIASNSYGKVLAEPNLVTLSGNSASFIAGGQFAVPTAVGVNGIGAVSTNFQGFGASCSSPRRSSTKTASACKWRRPSAPSMRPTPSTASRA